MAVNPTRSTWRRLKRNKGAVFGIIVIILSVLVAIFAHLIAPDPSPDANRMIVEIDGKKPGYTQQFLKLPRQGEFENASFFKMDNISLGYNVNPMAAGKLKARVSFTLQNAFFITKYNGLDPEVNGGIDTNLYPRPRVFMLGVNLTY